VDGFLALQDADTGQRVADTDAVALQPNEIALTDLPHHQGAHRIDERDARLEQDQWAEVRIPAANRASCVDHRGGAGVDEALGRDAIKILVVDHGDLAREDPPRQVLRPRIDACRTFDWPSTPERASQQPL